MTVGPGDFFVTLYMDLLCSGGCFHLPVLSWLWKQECTLTYTSGNDICLILSILIWLFLILVTLNSSQRLCGFQENLNPLFKS